MLSGQVEGPDLRRFACQVAVAHASRVWRSVRIEDGIIEDVRSDPPDALTSAAPTPPMRG